MLHGLRSLEQDASTKVIVLVSKPPSERVAAVVLGEARAMSTPVVVIFLGADPATFSDDRIHGVATLADAADLAVAIADGAAVGAAAGPSGTSSGAVEGETRRLLDDAVRRMSPEQRYIRGIFCGGTFCFEAQLMCQAAEITSWSNTPVAGNHTLTDIRVSNEHTIVDMGDDEFTQGRPHPMIDPTLRNERVANDAADPTTAVLLIDVVLGYGSADDPVSGLLEVLGHARSQAADAGRHLAIVAHVCGTDADPQQRDEVIAELRAAGAFVASSNAEAARWAAHIAASLTGREQEQDQG
jgi:succinyl-CoA synthetase alpha subunit